MTVVVRVFTGLLSAENHSKLSISPTELDLLSIALVICLFAIRSVLSIIGLGNHFTLLDTNDAGIRDGRTKAEQRFALPDHSLSMPLRLERKHNVTFSRATLCRPHVRLDIAANHAHLCLYLAAVSEPAMLLLLAKHRSPIRPLGAVNVRNRFELLHLDLCRALIEHAESFPGSHSDEPNSVSHQWSVIARFPGAARRVRRGIEIDIEVCIAFAGTRSGEQDDVSKAVRDVKAVPTTIFRQEFTMLQFMKLDTLEDLAIGKKSDNTTSVDERSSVTMDESSCVVSMSMKEPHTWASLCKDYNPIHFSRLCARLLGQSGQLAHGNHAVAACIQSMTNSCQEHSPDLSGKLDAAQNEIAEARLLLLNKLTKPAQAGKVWSMKVRFRRPIILPTTIKSNVHKNGTGFDVLDTRSTKVCVEIDIEQTWMFSQ